MKKTFYEKRGRRYVPVREYDSDLLDSFAAGSHLVTVVPGGRSTVCNIDPNYAAMIAAGRVATEAIVNAMHDADLPQRPDGRKMTDAEIAAWNNLIAVWGDSARTLTRGGIRTVADAGVKAMEAEADKLLEHPSVREAWNHFQTVVKLCYVKTR